MTGYPAISLPFGFKRNSIDSAGKIDSKYCSPKDDQDSPTKNRDSLDASVEYLPIGIQLIGRKFDEATLLSAAAAIEKYVIM
jgi:Asp-tRNA(Asn)/Glu-tRNA(Gln) amidotransferase A subunit family amidase